MNVYNHTITVTVQQLTDASSGEAVMSYACYKMLAYRKSITVLRPGKGLDHCALVDYDSLPSRFKQRFIAIYGDPHMKENKEQELRIDTEARGFFEEYCLQDGTPINGDKITEFTINTVR